MNGAELFERAARERPGDPGLFYFDTAIEFGRAAEMARGLASSLHDQLGLRPGDRVALMLQNVPQFPIAVHAVWLCGGIITTVNPMNKEGELRRQLADSGARLIICLESLFEIVAGSLDGTAVEHVITCSELEMLDEVPGALAGHERVKCPETIPLADLLRRDGSELAVADIAPDSPALLMYTSGTTGVPKGAIITHRAVVHNAEVMTEWGSLGPDDVTVAMSPLFHITGLICHLATSWASRTPLLLLFRFEPGEILRLIEHWRGSYVIGPLTAFVAMLDHPSFSERDLSSLTKTASGGAPVYGPVVERWEQATGSYLYNSYGLTETAAPTHLIPFGSRPPVDPESGALSVGVPIADTESRLVAVDDGSEVPPGCEGEILTRGPGVMPGYWNRPQESTEVIVDGWLHTGDIGKRDADGWFYVVDRIKDMINVSGYKVWPREVENTLYKHPAVVEAAVVGAPDSYRGETTVAYVVLRPGLAATEAELIAHCRALLSVYKSPRRVVFIDEIPKTLTGKSLRRELRERERLASES